MQERSESLRLDYRFLLFGCLGTVAAAFLSVVGPVLLGRHHGHGWGLTAATAVIVVWIYLKAKLKMAPTTMLAWAIALALFVTLAVYQMVCLF